MREYETTVIVQPEISSEGAESILQRMDGVLEGSGSTRLMCADLGKRKLAYEISKFQKGHYYVLLFLDDGKAVDDLESTLRIEESVLRFMTVKVTDEVADIEVRQEEARIAEAEQQKRAAEKAAREAEEAAAREEVERQAAEEARQQAEAAAKATAEAASESAEAAGDAPEEGAAAAGDAPEGAEAAAAEPAASDDEAGSGDEAAKTEASSEEASADEETKS